jgi:hypothetical protein
MDTSHDIQCAPAKLITKYKLTYTKKKQIHMFYKSSLFFIGYKWQYFLCIFVNY